jgi:FtsP/CotA-like multicopper oxidase with cupredoxin domain
MQSRKLSLGMAAGAIAAAVVLFVVLKGNGGSDSPSSANQGPARITFKNGAPVGGVREIEVAQGEVVRIDVTPDVPAEVHVHGYELEKDVKPGQTAKFDFPATAEGVFEVEVHHLVHGSEQTGVQVAELKVTP